MFIFVKACLFTEKISYILSIAAFGQVLPDCFTDVEWAKLGSKKTRLRDFG